MFQHMLVPLDGSSRAEQALPIAARLVRASGGTLTILRVVTSLLDMDLRPVPLSKDMELTQEVDIARADEYLAQVTASDDLKGITIRTETLTGPPAQTILLFAEFQHVDLIVTCSHGLTGFKRWWLGSVAQHVARSSPTPVLLLHECTSLPLASRPDGIGPLCVLVALDGSLLAEAALEPVASLCTALAAPTRGTLHLTCILQPPLGRARKSTWENTRMTEQAILDVRAYLSGVAQRLRLREDDLATRDLVITTSVVVQEDVADTLVRLAEHGEFTQDIKGFDGCDCNGYTRTKWPTTLGDGKRD